MDGLAGTQAACAGIAIAIAGASHGHADIAWIALALAASSAGFLFHNMPPAKLFMGDGGSTLLGFSFAALALMGAGRGDPVPFACAPLALAPFLLDGVFTLFRRSLRGEKVWRAHRTHLYQRAASAGRAHHDVLVAYAIWMGLAATAAVVASRGRPLAVAAAGGAMLAISAVAIVWVAQCERQATSK